MTSEKPQVKLLLSCIRHHFFTQSQTLGHWDRQKNTKVRYSLSLLREKEVVGTLKLPTIVPQQRERNTKDWSKQTAKKIALWLETKSSASYTIARNKKQNQQPTTSVFFLVICNNGPDCLRNCFRLHFSFPWQQPVYKLVLKH